MNVCQVRASNPVIQSPCLPTVVPIVSSPWCVLIVCVEELLDIYTRGVMVPIKSSNNTFAPHITKLHLTVVRLSQFFPYSRRH